MTEREHRGLGQSYGWHTQEILKSCRRINDRVDTTALEIWCGQEDTPENRKGTCNECMKVAKECLSYRSLEGTELEAAAKRILGEGQLF